MGVVVVGDDDPDMADFVTLALELAGHTVHTALDGGRALGLVRSHHPDLLILDHHMPVMNGLDVARAIRADPAVPRLPIVMISGDRPAGTAGLVDKLLVKPMRPRELATVVREFLPPQRPVRDASAEARTAI